MFSGNRNWGRIAALEKVLLVFLFVSAFLSAVPAEARVGTLYKGSTPLGPVPVMDGKEGLVVSIADAGALLGLNASVVGEELLLSHGTGKLKIVVDAVAAWYNTQLVPLYGASYVQDGKWWLDVPSSVSLLQRFAGRGNGDRLRVEDVGPAPGEESAVPKEPPKTKIPLTVPQKTDSQPPASRVVVVSEPVQTPPPAEVRPVPAPSPTQPAAVQAPGEIRAIRWSTSREKIRMVVDCSEGTNPEIKVVPGKISMMFTKAADDLQGIPSPYDNVKAELVQNSKDSATLALSTATAGIRVEKLILDNPRRIVLDFILTSPADIQETASGEQAPPPIGVPADTGQIVREAPKKSGKLLVVLDPGHGGKDPGAVGNGFREKDINLAIGLKMERSLKNKGFDVKMTRNTDIYLKLQERTDIANKANADMFVSIHVNALPPGKNSSGFEIYLMALPTDKDALALAKIENREYVEDKSANGEASDRKTELLLKILGDMQQNNKINESTVVAEALFKAGNSQGIPMKRVRQAPFFVLRGAGMPAVLLETGFITNANEAKLLAHAGYQQKIADAMVDGIRNYFKE